jgi:hypothetical protein
VKESSLLTFLPAHVSNARLVASVTGFDMVGEHGSAAQTRNNNNCGDDDGDDGDDTMTTMMVRDT